MGASSARTTENATRGLHPSVRHAVETILHEERQRWAMQIHDGLTQSVTSAVLELQTLRARIDADPEGAIGSLHEVEEEIRADLQRIRDLLFEMTEASPSAGTTFAGIVREAEERWHLAATLDTEGDVDAAAEEALEAAYAIVNEALTNAGKHSGTTDASVRVRADEENLVVEVEDHGRGLAAVPEEGHHFGLGIMRARAEGCGGSLEMRSNPGRGTTVVAVLPVGGRGERG